MAGSRHKPLPGGHFAAVLAASFWMSAGAARAQDPSAPVSPTGTAASVLAEIADSVNAPDVMPAPATQPVPTFYPGFGPAPAAPRVVMGPIDTIGESIFGHPDPDTWRPLPWWTFFSEGWNEAWVPSPNGSGGAPRQGWINAMDGNMYRLWFFTFAQGFNDPPKGNAYLGSYTIFTPLSRRLDLITNIPFVLRNNVVTGLPIVDPTGGPATATKSHSGFGDMSFTPRFLIHETQDFTLTTELAVVVPTGTQPLAGNTTSLVPAISFWNNPMGRWVIRGGVGVFTPLQGGSKEELISQFAIGQTLTDHNVRFFGDFTYYLSTVVNTPLANGDLTRVTLTPGIRTHLGNDWYFLAGLPTPVTNQRVADLGMIFWFMKAW